VDGTVRAIPRNERIAGLAITEPVRRFTRPPFVWIVAAVATAAGVLAISSATDDSGTSTGPTTAASQAPAASAPAERHGPPHRGASNEGETRRQVHKAVRESPAARLDAAQRQVVGVVRAYVAALNASDGTRACALFVPGALSTVHFPVDRGGCASSLSASIGYRDPRGFPVYDSSRVARVPGVTIDGSDARVTATIVTRFAGNREPSVEDDVIYLRRVGSRWLIAKPSATLYRAIGVGNIPPQVIAPPHG
jgi:hypothetical protein